MCKNMYCAEISTFTVTVKMCKTLVIYTTKELDIVSLPFSYLTILTTNIGLGSMNYLY